MVTLAKVINLEGSTRDLKSLVCNLSYVSLLIKFCHCKSSQANTLRRQLKQSHLFLSVVISAVETKSLCKFLEHIFWQFCCATRNKSIRTLLIINSSFNFANIKGIQANELLMSPLNLSENLNTCLVPIWKILPSKVDNNHLSNPSFLIKKVDDVYCLIYQPSSG